MRQVAEESPELLGQAKSFICQSQQKIMRWSIKGSCVTIGRSVNWRSNPRITFFPGFRVTVASAACIIPKAEMILINAEALFSLSHID